MEAKLFEMYLCRAVQFHDRLDGDLFAEALPLDVEILHSPMPLPVDAPPRGEYRKIGEGEPWGKLWESGYFRLSGKVPESWKGRAVWLRLEMGGEALLFDSGYHALTSLTNTSAQVRNFRKTLYPALEPAQGGENFTFYAEVAANGFVSTSRDSEIGVCRQLKFGLFRSEVWALRNDFRAVLSLLAIHKKPPYASPGGFRYCDAAPAPAPANHHAARLCRVLNAAIDIYADTPENAGAARQTLLCELQSPASRGELTTTAVGHAHIDIGFNWTITETRRKACRTFAAQLWNIGRYPGYVFGASQPQLYAFVKERMPQVYARIREAVKAGSWELQGGMWVEADCNSPSGESLCRQFIHGKNFYRDEFGVDVRHLWLPDVFGFSAALPQIMRAAGCEAFLSQKLSWSEFNRFPHNSFIWRGLGGAEVVAHFPPEDNYNSYLEPAALNFAENNYQENHLLDEFLTLFGAGDGGGGPKMEHIEAGRREANLQDTPHVKFGRAADFFDRLIARQDKLPVWDGELYLEFHQGTLTNTGKIKRFNRKLEQQFITTEMLLAMAPAETWPRRTLDTYWKRFLMYQFHDILPGTSIPAVNTEALEGYREIQSGLERLAVDNISRQYVSAPGYISFFNSLNIRWSKLLRLPESWRGHVVRDTGNRELPTQCDADGVWCRLALEPLGGAVAYRGEAQSAPPEPTAERDANSVLENALVRYEFKCDGTLTRAFDKRAGREILTGDGGNRLLLQIDRPRIFEGWNIESADRATAPLFATAAGEPEILRGELRSRIRFKLKIGNSVITQTAVLESDSARLDFETVVDFNETRRILRVVFTTGVKTNEAICDIQHGFIRRPTHRNTSWDAARTEFAAQRYIALFDDRGGAALLNDCKYGYSAHGGVMGLSLLRSPALPDPGEDRERHEFTYSFLPAVGNFEDSGVIDEAAALNREPVSFEDRAAILELPFKTETGNLAVEAFKRAEKSDDLILRLLETRGKHTAARVKIHADEVHVCDLLEWKNGDLTAPGPDGFFTFDFRPFEFITLRLSGGHK